MFNKLSPFSVSMARRLDTSRATYFVYTAALALATAGLLCYHGGGNDTPAAPNFGVNPACSRAQSFDSTGDASDIASPVAAHSVVPGGHQRYRPANFAISCSWDDGGDSESVSPASPPDCVSVPAWELWAQDNGCSDEAFELIRTAAAEYERDDVDMACLLACIAYPESTFRIGVKGAAGERGLVQIHPIHRQRMCKLGLDFDSELDRLRFACILLTTAFEFGGDLSDALQPWSPRKRIERQYRALIGEAESE